MLIKCPQQPTTERKEDQQTERTASYGHKHMHTCATGRTPRTRVPTFASTSHNYTCVHAQHTCTHTHITYTHTRVHSYPSMSKITCVIFGRAVIFERREEVCRVRCLVWRAAGVHGVWFVLSCCHFVRLKVVLGSIKSSLLAHYKQCQSNTHSNPTHKSPERRCWFEWRSSEISREYSL